MEKGKKGGEIERIIRDVKNVREGIGRAYKEDMEKRESRKK